MTSLFSQANIKGYIIKNRIVMPPVVRFGLTDNDGFVTKEHIEQYEKIAKGGAGLIIVESTSIDKEGRLADTQLGIWSDAHIGGLRKITEACHKHGAVVLIQINHSGIRTSNKVTTDIVAPSDIIIDEKIARALAKLVAPTAIALIGRTARALTIDEIHNIQNQYVDAARRAKQAGFDGIELHGAHCYLIDQFMSPIINKRKDEYGGSLENRMRFVLEIIEATKNEMGSDFIIDYRLGGVAPALEDGIEIAKALEENGIDLLHVSGGVPGDELPIVPEEFPYSIIAYIGTEIKKNVQIPVIVVNGIRKSEQASYLIENSLADFVALAKAQLVDPEWSNKAKSGDKIITCLECNQCQWYVDGRKCPRNKRH